MGACWARDDYDRKGYGRMGITRPEWEASLDFDSTLKADRDSHFSHRHILVTGCRGAGVKTFFLNLHNYYHPPNTDVYTGTKKFSDNERRELLPHILSCVIKALKHLCELFQAMQEFNKETKISSDVASTIDFFLSDMKVCGTKALPEHIHTLWTSHEIQEVWKSYERPNKAGIAYFATKINQLVSKDYLPTDQDLLHLREGIGEFTITPMEGLSVKFYDLSKIGYEPRKWISMFEDKAEVFIYIVDLCCYDEINERNQNQMAESLLSFEFYVNNRWIVNDRNRETFIIFNKFEEFREKIKSTPITVCFPEFKLEEQADLETKDPCLTYIIDQFLSKSRGHQGNRVTSLTLSVLQEEDFKQFIDTHVLTEIRRQFIHFLFIA